MSLSNGSRSRCSRDHGHRHGHTSGQGRPSASARLPVAFVHLQPTSTRGGIGCRSQRARDHRISSRTFELKLKLKMRIGRCPPAYPGGQRHDQCRRRAADLRKDRRPCELSPRLPLKQPKPPDPRTTPADANKPEREAPARRRDWSTIPSSSTPSPCQRHAAATTCSSSFCSPCRQLFEPQLGPVAWADLVLAAIFEAAREAAELEHARRAQPSLTSAKLMRVSR